MMLHLCAERNGRKLKLGQLLRQSNLKHHYKLRPSEVSDVH